MERNIHWIDFIMNLCGRKFISGVCTEWRMLEHTVFFYKFPQVVFPWYCLRRIPDWKMQMDLWQMQRILEKWNLLVRTNKYYELCHDALKN